MSEDLKPCPFCGGEARIITVGMFYHCECEDCCATSDHSTNREYAITLWNTRPNPWHTGTPTEKGWYLYEYGATGGDYSTYYAITKKRLAYLKEVKRWQKIEP